MTVKRWLAVPLLALGLGLTACSGAAKPAVATAGGGAATAGPSPSAVSDEERGRRFTECMREHGVDLPDPQPGGKLGASLDGVDKDKVFAAVDACREFMPNGGADAKLDPGQLDRQRAFAECMRANGVPDFPDPDPEGGAIREYILDKHDDDVLAALDQCRDIVPAPSGSAGAGK